MINANSRYVTATLQTVEHPQGTRQEMRIPWPRARQISFTFYAVRSGDRAEGIAGGFLGDERLWWMLADANPEIMDWAVLDVGTILRIPNG